MKKLSGHAFISYVREDSLDVDRLQRTLEAAGIPVWRDTADLWPGEDWRSKIRHAISGNALVFIACFSSRSLARRRSYQNEELLLAIDQLRQRRPDDPWLIPVRFDDCDIPDLDLGGGRTLASIQRSDLFGDRDLGAARLVVAVLRILGRHDPDQDPGIRSASLKYAAEAESEMQSADIRGSDSVNPSRQSPLVFQGRRSKVLELDLPAGGYRMSWTTEGRGLFAVRHESGRGGEGALVVSVATPSPDSGEQIVRIIESGRQIFSVEAPKLEWALSFGLLMAKDAEASHGVTTMAEGKSVQIASHNHRSYAILTARIRQSTQCLQEIIKLTGEFTAYLQEATPQLLRARGSKEKLEVLDTLAVQITPIAMQYEAQSIRYQGLAGEVDQRIQGRLAAIGLIPPEQWDSATLQFLESIRRGAESHLQRLDSLMSMHDDNNALMGRSPRLDAPLRRLQSAIILMSHNRGAITNRLEALETLGY